MESLLNVAIGLLFIYSLLSLLVSELEELLSTYFWDGRARNLFESIQTLLGESMTQLLYQHPLIKSLKDYKQQVNHRFIGPSYIPDDVFAMALIRVILAQTQLNLTPEPAEPLLNHSPESQLDYSRLTAALNSQSLQTVLDPDRIELFKVLGLQATLQTNLETSYLQALQRELTIWFTQAMERASGVYKRRVRSHTLLIGLILAIVLNADTLNMANRLAEEPLLQERLLQTFEQSSLIYPPENLTPSGNQLDVFALLAEVSMLPVGWSAENLIGQFGQALEPRTDVLKVLRVLLGWSLTAIATSMGSSFWFDLLNQVVNVRNTGKKPPGIQGDKSV